jgi:hypothetical protein
MGQVTYRTLTRLVPRLPSPTNCVGEGINVAHRCGALPQVRSHGRSLARNARIAQALADRRR